MHVEIIFVPYKGCEYMSLIGCPVENFFDKRIICLCMKRHLYLNFPYEKLKFAFNFTFRSESIQTIDWLGKQTSWTTFTQNKYLDNLPTRADRKKFSLMLIIFIRFCLEAFLCKKWIWIIYEYFENCISHICEFLIRNRNMTAFK